MPLLSNLARTRKERWRGEVWPAFVVVVEERCLPGESLSPVTATSDQQCPKACPTCGMQHAQSVLQSTCIANQPLPLHSVCLSICPANAARLQRDVTYSFFLAPFCDCVDSPVDIILLLALVLSVVEVVAAVSVLHQVSSQLPFRIAPSTSTGISRRVESRPYHCSLPDPGTAFVCPLTSLLSVVGTGSRLAGGETGKRLRRCCV